MGERRRARLARAYLLRLRALLALLLRLSTAQLLVPRQSGRERVTWVPKLGAGLAGTVEPLDQDELSPSSSQGTLANLQAKMPALEAAKFDVLAISADSVDGACVL